MVSFWTYSRISHKQVFADIESVLEAILKLCTTNLDSLTQEERSSFMDEYSSVADARVRWDKDTAYSTLTKALDECEKLKLRIERACSKHQEDIIRRGSASPAPTSIATLENRESSITLIESNPSYRTPLSESSISAQSNLAVTSGSHRPSDPPTGTSSYAVSSSACVAHETFSVTSAASMEGNPSELSAATECMIFDADSSIGSPTFNIDSKGATGATITSPGDGSSPGPPAQRLPPAGARQSQTAYTMRRERVMMFAPGTAVNSPTFNIRSPRGSGTIEQVVAHRSEGLTGSFS